MRQYLAAVVIGSLAGSVAAETMVENGITYEVTRRREKTPVTNVRMEERTETVYRTESVTQFREQSRTVWVAVTDYTYQPRWQNGGNLFAQPVASYELKPVVRWEPRTETVQVPITVHRTVPETRICQVPVRSLGFVEREVVERVAVQTLPAGQSPGSQLAGGQSAARTLAPAPAASLGRPARLATSNLYGSPNLDGSRSVPAMGAGTVRR